MPRKAKIPCSFQGCSKLIESGSGNYCDEHRKVKNSVYNKTRDDKSTIATYSTPRWKRVRKLALARDQGLCQICKEANAELVDHIHEIKDGGDPFDLSNLQSLCHKCHSQKTRDEQKKREP